MLSGSADGGKTSNGMEQPRSSPFSGARPAALRARPGAPPFRRLAAGAFGELWVLTRPLRPALVRWRRGPAAVR